MGCGVSDTESNSNPPQSAGSGSAMVPPAHRVNASHPMAAPAANRRAGPREVNGDFYETQEAQLKEVEAKVVSKLVLRTIFACRIVEGQFSGEGIKRTTAYETKLTETQYISARELFWSNETKIDRGIETRIQGDQVTWGTLKLICESEPRISDRI